ncbi:MAG TPA: TonB-dependent receptor [Bacteroidales bacterium]|nr:TonB-dependent receptor [Bacteroidales bacterium]
MKICFISIVLLNLSLGIFSQSFISGKIADARSGEPVQYASIGLFRLPDSVLIKGAISDSTGCFNIERIPSAKYRIVISMAGYDQYSQTADMSFQDRLNTGVINLREKSIELGATVITADKLKGKAEKEKTLYYITNKMATVSSNGIDVLKLVPGVQVDLNRNIILEGSRDVVILVDGIERDNSYLTQIMPYQIDRIEIQNMPSSKYSGDKTGVVNIILKRNHIGLNGQFNLELPVNSSLYYLHPDYTVKVALKKFTVYTSCNAENISFDQHESLRQHYRYNNLVYENNSDQFIRQNTNSYRFHYGFDLQLNKKSQVNFYAFYNPYSQKYSGRAGNMQNGSGEWKALRYSKDQNTSTYYSLFFKHNFNENGNDFSVDITSYNYSGIYRSRFTTLNNDSDIPAILNISKPSMNSLSLKTDANARLSEHLGMNAGTRISLRNMKENTNRLFSYHDNVYAAYMGAVYNRQKVNVSSGLRLEYSEYVLKNSFSKHHVVLLPFLLAGYKISNDRNFKTGINRTIRRPNLYQLNPVEIRDDLYNFHKGNASLKPECRTTIFFEYAGRMKSNYFSLRLFYDHVSDVLGNLSLLKDTVMIGSLTDNTGKINQFGILVSRTFKIGKSLSFIPYLKIYSNHSRANSTASHYSIPDKDQIVAEPGFSSIFAFRHDISMSMVLQCSTPRNSIGSYAFSDPLYILSAEKTIQKRLKLGVSWALPFCRNFTYQGSDYRSGELSSRYSGEIELHGRPLFWFKLGYSFNSGKTIDRPGHSVDESEILPKKGF